MKEDFQKFYSLSETILWYMSYTLGINESFKPAGNPAMWYNIMVLYTKYKPWHISDSFKPSHKAITQFVINIVNAVDVGRLQR